MTGEEEVDLLVRRFIEVEDRNFALFNYVNEQNNEIELLKEQIQQVGLQSYPSYFSRKITPTLLRWLSAVGTICAFVGWIKHSIVTG